MRAFACAGQGVASGRGLPCTTMMCRSRSPPTRGVLLVTKWRTAFSLTVVFCTYQVAAHGQGPHGLGRRVDLAEATRPTAHHRRDAG